MALYNIDDIFRNRELGKFWDNIFKFRINVISNKFIDNRDDNSSRSEFLLSFDIRFIGCILYERVLLYGDRLNITLDIYYNSIQDKFKAIQILLKLKKSKKI